MKKFFNQSFFYKTFLVFCFILIPFSLQAQEKFNSTSKVPIELIQQSLEDSMKNVEFEQPKVVTVATVNVYDFKIKSQNNNRFNLNFLVTNEEKSQPDIKYGINLLAIDENGEEKLVDEKIYSEVFDLAPNSEVAKNIIYEAPRHLKGNFSLRLMLRSSSGLLLAVSQSEVFILQGDNKYLEIIKPSCFLTIKGDDFLRQYTLDQGVDLKFEEKLILNCKIKNNSDEDLKINPTFETFFRTTFGKKMGESENVENDLNIKKNEKKEIQIVIPKNSKAQAYDTKVYLNNDKKIPSDFITVHYVMSGKGATIQNLLLDKNYYQKGEEANISFFYTGSADNFPDNRLGGTKIEETALKLNIKDEYGNICGKTIEKALDDNVIEHKMKYFIEKNCLSPLVEVLVLDKSTGEVLASSEFKFNSDKNLVKDNESEKKTEERDLLFLVIFIIGLVLMVLLIIILFIKNKNKFLVSFFLLFLSSFLFGLKSVEAKTSWVRYDVKYQSGGWVKHDFLMTYGLESSSFTLSSESVPNYSLGAEIFGSIWLSEFTCNNVIPNAHLQIQIPAGAQYEKHNNAMGSLRYNPGRTGLSAGSYDAIFHFADLRRWVTGYSFNGTPSVVLSIPFKVSALTPTTCTASCSTCTDWEDCSKSCGTGSQTCKQKNCTRTDCSTYSQTRDCNPQACCNPFCGNPLNYCSSYSDGCTAGACTGTATCSGTQCYNNVYTCSGAGGMTYTTTGDYWQNICGASSQCGYVDSSDDAPCNDSENCNKGNSCGDDSSDEELRSRCSDTTTVEYYTRGKADRCTPGPSPSGGCSAPFIECEIGTVLPDKVCEVGYVCRQNGTNAECVAKSSTWTEI